MSASGVRSRAAATMARNSSVSVGLSVAGQFGPWGVSSTAESPTIRTTSARKAWVLARQQPHVQRRARHRGNDVRLVAALKARDRDGVAEQRVVGEVTGEEAHRGGVAQG